MLKDDKDIIFFKFFFPIIPMRAIRYSCPIRKKCYYTIIYIYLFIFCL